MIDSFGNFSKTAMNFSGTVSQTPWKNWACQYFQNYHELFPKLIWNFWKLFKVVLETFHALKMLLGQCDLVEYYETVHTME
jgi:hypothetical protein